MQRQICDKKRAQTIGVVRAQHTPRKKSGPPPHTAPGAAIATVVAVPVAERDQHSLLLARCLSLTQPLVGLLAVQAEPRAEGMDVDVLEQ